MASPAPLPQAYYAYMAAQTAEVSCDKECIATVALGTATLIMALYDVYFVSTCMRHIVAPRRHLVVILGSLGLYAFLNGMSALFPLETLMWAGLMSFLRIYFVYHFFLHQLSLLFVDGFGDFEELVEKTGNLVEASDSKKGAAWVQTSVLLMQVWMAETVASFIVKNSCATYGQFVTIEDKRVSIWEGGFMYIVIIDIVFTLICGSGMSKLSKIVEPMLLPNMRYLVHRRGQIFQIFYLGVSLIYPSIITLVFTANVGVSDDTYGWWTKHMPIFVACHLLPLQWVVHKYFVPRYSWSFNPSSLLAFKKRCTSRESVPRLLAELGITLHTQAVCDHLGHQHADHHPKDVETAADVVTPPPDESAENIGEGTPLQRLPSSSAPVVVSSRV